VARPLESRRLGGDRQLKGERQEARFLDATVRSAILFFAFYFAAAGAVTIFAEISLSSFGNDLLR
jgi:hypothetical protein